MNKRTPVLGRQTFYTYARDVGTKLPFEDLANAMPTVVDGLEAMAKVDGRLVDWSTFTARVDVENGRHIIRGRVAPVGDR